MAMRLTIIFFYIFFNVGCNETDKIKIFDVHLHGHSEPESQVARLADHGVEKIAVSTSWQDQQRYRPGPAVEVFSGLFVPCPNGRVPYSLQPCFDEGNEWPDINWVENQIKENKIHFIGEVLTQYHGISSSDSLMYPYYALAEKYELPVGIHTGSAGPDHGCANFKEEMGNPLLLKSALEKFPKLKAWVMHGGGPYLKECIAMMKGYPNVYADISVLNNPDIVPFEEFQKIIKAFIDAGLEDRLFFGSDNADIDKCIASVEKLDFLSSKQRKKIFFDNANAFFSK